MTPGPSFCIIDLLRRFRRLFILMTEKHTRGKEWAIPKEWSNTVVLAGGFSAIAEQLGAEDVSVTVAHAGGFDKSQWERLALTLIPVFQLVVSSQDKAKAAAHWINTTHGPFRKKFSYKSSVDPELTQWQYLSKWVIATIAKNAIETTQALDGRPFDRDQFIQDSTPLSTLLGIPRSSCFQSYEEVTAMYDATPLCITDDARRIVDSIFQKPFGMTLGVRFMHPRIRQLYGFQWTQEQEEGFQKKADMARRISQKAPGFLREAIPHLLAKLPLSSV